MPTQNKPCTIEVIRHALHSKPVVLDAGRCRSVREARDILPYAVSDVIDPLSSASYDVRLRFEDGRIRFLSNNRQGFAIEAAKAIRYRNSIGYRLRMGEAVAV